MLRTYLPDESLDATGTTIGLIEGDFTNDGAAVFSVESGSV